MASVGAGELYANWMFPGISGLWQGPNDFGSQGGTSIGPDTVNAVQNIQSAAKDFSSNLPQYIQNQYNNSAEQTAQQASAGDKAINAASSKRGLLYSGLNEGAKAQNRSNLAQALMDKKAQLNQQGQSMDMAYQTAAANAGIGLANAQNQAAWQQYQGNVAGSKQNPGFIGGLLQAF